MDKESNANHKYLVTTKAQRLPNKNCIKIVREYIDIYRPCKQGELENIKDLGDCVRGIHPVDKETGKSIRCGKPSESRKHTGKCGGHCTSDTIWKPKGSHQNRIPEDTLKKAVEALDKNNILSRKFNDFEELYDAVKTILVPAIFKGECLAVYDTALRIGQLLKPKVEPKDYVYLFCGAKEGAEKLLGRKVQSREKTSVFSNLFPGLTALEIEDALCIFKDRFQCNP